MRRIIAVTHLTLDGVMQAPARPNEDLRDGFEHGGWAIANHDAVMMQAMGKNMTEGGPLLFGRRTYMDFFAVWPGRKDNRFTSVLDNAEKYVASRTLKEPLPWRNSTLLPGDARESVPALKEQPGKDITVLGCGDLMQTLLREELVDVFVLLIHPLVLGKGRRLFGELTRPKRLRLVDSLTTTTGVAIATYHAAKERS